MNTGGRILIGDDETGAGYKTGYQNVLRDLSGADDRVASVGDIDVVICSYETG